MSLLFAENVVKKYANHLALDHVSINVPEGHIFGLLGPNGAGKTSLIRIINQITAPDEGNIYFKGQKLKPDDVSQIGYLPEERGLYKKMKIGEQAIYLAQLKGLPKKEATEKLKNWFRKFQIESWWNKKVEELSKGMQQKVQFIVTIVHEPKLLIFDEPFSGFDPINANLLKNEILELREKGSTIIFSTHNMASVEELCDDIALINNGKTILNGSLNDVKNQFKPNEFEILFDSSFDSNLITENENFKLLNVQNLINGNFKTQIKLHNGYTTNNLLQNCIKAGNIISFNEIIPSMNDIFIKIIEEQNKQ